MRWEILRQMKLKMRGAKEGLVGSSVVGVDKRTV
jgi:hypothetical protein